MCARIQPFLRDIMEKKRLSIILAKPKKTTPADIVEKEVMMAMRTWLPMRPGVRLLTPRYVCSTSTLAIKPRRQPANRFSYKIGDAVLPSTCSQPCFASPHLTQSCAPHNRSIQAAAANTTPGGASDTFTITTPLYYVNAGAVWVLAWCHMGACSHAWHGIDGFMG